MTKSVRLLYMKDAAFRKIIIKIHFNIQQGIRSEEMGEQ